MDIFRHQLRRILCAPFFFGLLAAFLAFDLYLISTLSGVQRELNLINDIAGQTGVQINENFEKKFTPILNAHTKDLETLYRQKAGKAPADASSMLKSLSQDYYTLTEEQQRRFRDDSTIVQLDGAIKGRNAFYEGYDVGMAGRTFIRQNKIGGASAEWITRNCDQLQDRVVQIKADGEKDTLFFPGAVYQVHGFLYGTLLKAIVMESAILGVLVLFFTLNYEFTHGTQSLAYTSRRGRRLPTDQFRAAMLVGILIPVFLMAVTLPVFFCSFHFSNLWGSSVSSAMNAEQASGSVPYLTFRPMTMLQYLLANIGLTLVVQTIFCLFAFAAALFCRNSYLGFLGYGLVGMLLSILPQFVPLGNLFYPLLSATPVFAWQNCGTWLTQINLFTAYPWYHAAVFSLGVLVTAMASLLGIRRFRRADL